MRNSRQEAVRIRRQVHPRKLGLQVQHGTNESRVLVTEAVMFLPRPSRSLDVVEGGDFAGVFALEPSEGGGVVVGVAADAGGDCDFVLELEGECLGDSEHGAFIDEE